MSMMKKRPSVRGKKVAIGRAVDCAEDFVVEIRNYEERPVADEEEGRTEPDEDVSQAPVADSFSEDGEEERRCDADADGVRSDGARDSLSGEESKPDGAFAADEPVEPAFDGPSVIGEGVDGGASEESRGEDAAQEVAEVDGAASVARGDRQGEEAASSKMSPGVAKAVEELAAIERSSEAGLARFDPEGGFLPPDVSAGPSDTFDLGDLAVASDDGRPGAAAKGISEKAFPLKGSLSGALAGEAFSGDRPKEKAAFPSVPTPKDATRWIKEKTESLGLASKPKTMDDVRPEEQKASDFSAEEIRAKGARQKAERKARNRRLALLGAIAFFSVTVLVSSLVFWNMYLRYDDAADIKGEWQVSDGSMTIVIDDSAIHMPDSLDYEYSIDTWEKTISFSFMDLAGKGSYHFSSDRQVLIIREGSEDTEAKLSLVKVSDDVSAEPAFAEEAPAEGEEAPQEGGV